jgi:uncharacterized membrane protein
MHKSRIASLEFVSALTVVALVGCRVDQPTTPDVQSPTVAQPNLSLHPVAAYTMVRPFAGHAAPSRTYDVNELGQVVGWHGNSAVVVDLGPPLVITYLPSGSRSRYEARGVNDKGEIVGLGSDGRLEYPVYWASPTSTPVELSVEGNMLEINNAGVAVGWIVKGWRHVPFLWETRTHRTHLIPVLQGASSRIATSINDDNIIAGDGVYWQYFGGGQFSSAYLPFDANDIDNGYTMVGRSRNAVFGTPRNPYQFIGTPPGALFSEAFGISKDGVAVGEVRFPNAVTLPYGVSEAFAVELFNLNGGIWMPKTSPLRSASARAVNSCGVIVGFESGGATSPPLLADEGIVWNPGC